MAAFGVWGIGVTALIVIVAFFFRRRYVRIAIVVGLTILWLVGSLSVHGYRETWRLDYCKWRLRSIGLALRAYHDAHGQFPPAYITDAEGRPMHSWRVLLLPYFGDQVIYKMYRFDEPWNSPNNLRLASSLEDMYRCPTTEDIETGTPLSTHFVAVTGPGTAWPGPESSKLEDFSDGDGNTIMLVEIAGSDINMLEPRDITLEQALAGKPYQIPSSHHQVERKFYFDRIYPMAGNVLMADGSTHFLGQRPSRNKLAALLSTGGGETIEPFPPNDHDYGNSFVPGFDRTRFIGFFVFAISMIMLVSCNHRPNMSSGSDKSDGAE
ncbi:MAG: DUF1559 domain-containing protein [Planctomycetota bacterium]|nr:DUF1559 domain-containing protein [Planctomycetota bacterium]